MWRTVSGYNRGTTHNPTMSYHTTVDPGSVSFAGKACFNACIWCFRRLWTPDAAATLPVLGWTYAGCLWHGCHKLQRFSELMCQGQSPLAQTHTHTHDAAWCELPGINLLQYLPTLPWGCVQRNAWKTQTQIICKHTHTQSCGLFEQKCVHQQ